MARDIPALYDTIASQVVDRLVEFGEARVSNVPDTALLRAAVRRAARRRNVKLLSRTLRDGFVIVVATEPGVEAEAYQTVTSSVIPDALDAARRSGQVEPLVSSRVLQLNVHDFV
jgi:hypothetical protein